MLAIHFDWEPQARAIVQGVRVGAADKARVLLVDSNFRVIAASDGQGLLTERVHVSMKSGRSGFYHDHSGGAGRVSTPRPATRPTGARLVRRDPGCCGLRLDVPQRYPLILRSSRSKRLEG